MSDIRVTPTQLAGALAPGRYEGVFVVDQPNAVIEPTEEGEVEFWRSRIEVRADGVTLRGLTFRQADGSAIVVESGRGATVEQCSFFACPQGVTVWLGDAAEQCVVRGCVFDLLNAKGPRHARVGHAHVIGIMCGERSRGHEIAGNTIAHYDYGVQLGAAGASEEIGNHHVRGNRILCPRHDGIHVKQHHCLVEGNWVVGSNVNCLSARGGAKSVFRDNRCEDAYLGIIVRGDEHEVTGNTFVRMRAAAIVLEDQRDEHSLPATNTLVADNTFADCGGYDFGQPIIHQAFIEGDPIHADSPIIDRSGQPQRIA